MFTIVVSCPMSKEIENLEPRQLPIFKVWQLWTDFEMYSCCQLQIVIRLCGTVNLILLKLKISYKLLKVTANIGAKPSPLCYRRCSFCVILTTLRLLLCNYLFYSQNRLSLHCIIMRATFMLEYSNLKSYSLETIFTNIHDNKDQSSAADRFWLLLLACLVALKV